MRSFLPLAITLLLCSACEDGTAVSDTATVTGHWELIRATRNNVETGLLDGLTFVFEENGNLQTNLMGNEAPGTYTWDDGEIITDGVKLPLTYTIRELTDSTLNLRSQYRSYQFDFDLRRVAAQH